MARERIEQQEVVEELAEAEIWGTSRTSALLRADAKERRQRRLRLGPFGETRAKAYGSSNWTVPADRPGPPSARDDVHDWASSSMDSATETAPSTTDERSFVDTDVPNEVWDQGDSSSYDSQRTSSEDDVQDSEDGVNSGHADQHWPDAQPRTSHRRPVLHGRTTYFSQDVDFETDEPESDSIDRALVPQREN
eukprot:COSAG02_NODE_20511_length_828_cov_0.710562_1_plen_192_part_10